MSEDTADPVALGIMWDRLVAVADDVLTAIVRTAFSVGVREAWDLACVVFDERGRSIAQARLSMPAFIGTAPLTMRHMLRAIPAETLVPGDVLVTNDPWHGTGHTPDICVARPVFHQGRLVGFVMTITHLPDIGGAGLAISNPDLFHEGLILPVCKLHEAGEPNALIYEIIRRNVRIVDEVFGDIEANVSGTAVGARLVTEFMDEYGLEDLRPLAEAIIQRSRDAIADALSAVEGGTYTNTVDVEAIDDTVRLSAAVTIRGGTAAIDFAGTGPMVKAAINVPLCYTRAFATFALKCLTTPNIPNNEGTRAPLKVAAPEGSILNAARPSPVGGRHTVGWFIVPLIFGALAQVLPGRVQADSGMASLMLVSGRAPGGRSFVTQYFLAGGLGAMDGKDGQHTVPFPTNNAVVPSEVWERETGLRVLHRRLLADSGGPGAWRGGLGQEVAMRNETGGDVHFSIFGLRTRFAAQGLAGGGDGIPRRFAIDGREIPAKGRVALREGETLTIREAGGGGFGDPAARPLDAIAADIAGGFVTLGQAQSVYGVRQGGDGVLVR
ncbi:MAG: hydantoinase B/oxoprolinase family protein [Pseudomonadota bacterium]